MTGAFVVDNNEMSRASISLSPIISRTTGTFFFVSAEGLGASHVRDNVRENVGGETLIRCESQKIIRWGSLSLRRPLPKGANGVVHTCAHTHASHSVAAVVATIACLLWAGTLTCEVGVSQRIEVRVVCTCYMDCYPFACGAPPIARCGLACMGRG